MEKLTFNEWKEKGYIVLKGEKACGRNEKGVAVFSEKQVTPIKHRIISGFPNDKDEIFEGGIPNDFDDYAYCGEEPFGDR